MKFKHKDGRKRRSVVAKNRTPPRFLWLSLILVGILLSASLFYYGLFSEGVIHQSLLQFGEGLSSLSQSVTGAAVGLDEMRVQEGTPLISSIILNSTDPTTNDTTTNLTAYVTSTNSTRDIIDWRISNQSIAVLNLPFEGGSNSTFTKDYSSFVNNGTVDGATWNATGGYDGKGAYEFHGIGAASHVYNLNPVGLANTNSSITIVAWAKTINNLTNADMVTVSDALGFGGSSNAIQVGVRGERFGASLAGGSLIIQSSVGFAEDQWYHVAYTYNGSISKIYVNGVEDNNSITPLQSGTIEAYFIGSYGSSGESVWNGSIDEVKIFNSSLSSEQILALYNNRTDSIVSQELTAGEVWSVCATPNNGSIDGNTSCSNEVTIQETASNTSTCGTLTSSLTLNNDVNSSGTCFNITASDLTLDCNGHTIYSALNNSGNYSYAITAQNLSNITIDNCIVIEGENAYYYSNAIYLSNINGMIFTNNRVYDNLSSYSPSFYCDNCNNSLIQNNIIYGNIKDYSQMSPALKVDYSENVSIINNTLFSQSNNANTLWLYYSNYLYLANNSIYGNGSSTSKGIFSQYTHNVSLDQNFVYSQNSRGIDIDSGNNYTLTNNNLNSTNNIPLYIKGTSAQHFNHTIGLDNSADGLPLLYNSSISNKVILSDTNVSIIYGQIICAWCDNVTYSNVTVATSGINLFSVNNSHILNSFFYNPKADSIYSDYSFNNTYEGNQLSSIVIDYDTSDNLNSNQVHYYFGDTPGIYLRSSSEINVSNNIINASCGAIPYYNCGGPSPVYIYYSSNILVKNNSLYGPGQYGIAIYAGTNSQFEDNYVQESIMMGNQEIHHNNFTNNRIGGPIICNGYNITFNNNVINVSSNDVAVSLGGPDNILTNNTIISPLNYEITSSTSYNNTITYHNDYGKINWTRTNISINIPLIVDQTIFLGNNALGIIDNSSMGSLNSTATLTFYNLGYAVQPYLLKNGIRCDDNSALCNITSYDNATGTLVAQVSSFSNYSTQETPSNPYPYWSGNISNIPTTYSSSTYSNFNITWTDDTNISIVYLESNYSGSATNYTLSRSSGNTTNGTYNYSAILPAGNFYWKSLANDSNNQWNSTPQYEFILAQNNGNCDVEFNQSSPLSYPVSFTPFTNCTSDFSLYQNGTTISNNSVQSLAAGSYNFTVVRTDQVNYSNIRDQEIFVINQASSGVNLTLNNSKSNLTAYNGTVVDVNCTKTTGEGNIYLYINGTLINSGASMIGNSTILTTGNYNFTCQYNSTQNYSASSEAYWVNISLYDNYPNVTLVSPAASYVNDSSNHINVTFICNATDERDVKNISLYLTNHTNQNFQLNQTTNLSGTSNSTSWTVPLSFDLANSFGNYTWNCLAYDNSSQASWGTNRSILLNYTIDSVTFTLNLTENNSFQLTGRELHTLTLNNATNTTSEVTFQSTPTNYSLTVNVSQLIDTNSDSYYDHNITLNQARDNSNATFTISAANTYYSTSSSSSSSSSSGGGSSSSSSSGSSSSSSGGTAPAESSVTPTIPTTPITPIEVPATEEVKPEPTPTPGSSAPFTGKAFTAGQLISDYGSYWVIAITGVLLFAAAFGGVNYYHKKKNPRFTYPSPSKPKLRSMADSRDTLLKKYEEINHLILEEKNRKEISSPKVITVLTTPKSIPVKLIKVELQNKPRITIQENTTKGLTLNQELTDIEQKLSRLDQTPLKSSRVVEEVPLTKGFSMYGEINSQQKKEYDGISKLLLYSLKRPYLLLQAFIPKRKTPQQTKAEEYAQREVKEISRKIEGNQPRPLNELEQIEEEIRRLK
ncbi:MAG: LamG-like jellyroll fold domain-containing protein [Candidatus Woesearchaeota archaeon]